MKNYSTSLKSRREFTRYPRRPKSQRLRETLGLSLEGSGPCIHTREPSYTVGSGTQDGVNSGTAVRGTRRRVSTAASNLDTHLDRGIGRSVRMLLSFQRPSRTSRRRGLPLRARSGSKRIPKRTDEYSAEVAALGRAWRRRLRTGLRAGTVAGLGPTGGHLGPRRHGRSGRRTSRRPQESTWTVTVRLRGRSSKSISTICCQVPRTRSPPTIGIVSEGPISAARRWAWELESWLRRLCS